MKLNKDKIRDTLKRIPEILSSQPYVSFCYVYGSTVDYLNGEVHLPPSDIDIAVYVNNYDIYSAENELEQMFYQEMKDIFNLIDLRVINSAPISFVITVITKGRLIYCRDEISHAEYIENISNTYRQTRTLIEEAYV